MSKALCRAALLAAMITAANIAAPQFAGAASPAWSVQITSNMTGPWLTLTNVAWSTGFARLQGPPGQSIAIGTVITIKDSAPPGAGQASMSNGAIIVTAPAASTNDYNAIASMLSPTNPLLLNIQRPQ